MTEQEKKEYETRKKIASTLLHANEIMEGHGFVFCLKLADALIAAGIGDVKTAQEIAASATAMAILEAAEAEHRAEVAEKIAEEACEIVFCEAIDNEEWDEVIRNYKETKEKYSDEFGITDEMLYDYLHEKAEKELQEGKENVR